MDQMFAPWRMEWVQREDPNDDIEGCLFCGLPNGNDRDRRVLARNEHAYVVLNNAPYAPGHAMVVPFDHVGDYHRLDEATMLGLSRLQSTTIAAIESAFHAEGFNVGMNIGAAGGASVEDHLHVHVVPRWSGDVTFMPATADTQVVVEALDESYERLHAELSSMTGGEAASDGAVRVEGHS